MAKQADINNPGDLGTLQRLLYAAPRVGYGYSWEQINGMAQDLLGKVGTDTELSLLLNAFCCATEEIVSRGKSGS